MAELRPPLSPPFAIFGVAATVTPLGGAPVATTIIWVKTGVFGSFAAFAAALGTPSDPRPRCRLRRDQVPSLPIGSTIVAPPPQGGAAQTFSVDLVDTLADEFEAVVSRAA